MQAPQHEFAADPYTPAGRLRQHNGDARDGDPLACSHPGPYVIELRQGRRETHSERAASPRSPKHSRARPSTLQSVQPDVLAPRASGDMLQHHRILDRQSLFRDRAFTNRDWSYHISAWRYVLEPKVLLNVLVALAVPLCVTLAVALGCALYQGLRAETQPDLRNLDLQFTYNLVTFAFALLLVFKTNTSYARFWDGAPAPSPAVSGPACSLVLSVWRLMRCRCRASRLRVLVARAFGPAHAGLCICPSTRGLCCSVCISTRMHPLAKEAPPLTSTERVAPPCSARSLGRNLHALPHPAGALSELRARRAAAHAQAHPALGHCAALPHAQPPRGLQTRQRLARAPAHGE